MAAPNPLKREPSPSNDDDDDIMANLMGTADPMAMEAAAIKEGANEDAAQQQPPSKKFKTEEDGKRDDDKDPAAAPTPQRAAAANVMASLSGGQQPAPPVLLPGAEIAESNDYLLQNLVQVSIIYVIDLLYYLSRRWGGKRNNEKDFILPFLTLSFLTYFAQFLGKSGNISTCCQEATSYCTTSLSCCSYWLSYSSRGCSSCSSRGSTTSSSTNQIS